MQIPTCIFHSVHLEPNHQAKTKRRKGGLEAVEAEKAKERAQEKAEEKRISAQLELEKEKAREKEH